MDVTTALAIAVVAIALAYFGNSAPDTAAPPPRPSAPSEASGADRMAGADPCDRPRPFGQPIPSAFQPTEADLCPTQGPFEATEIGQTVFDWPPDLSGQTGVPVGNIHAHNVMIVLDVSGSMEGRRLEAAKAAVRYLVGAAPPTTNLGLVFFGLKAWKDRTLPEAAVQTKLVVPLGTGNRFALRSALAAVQADGGTPTSIAIRVAATAMHQQYYRQMRFGQYDLIVVTDGQPNEGYEPDAAVRELHRRSPVTVHTVAFSTDIPHLQALERAQMVRYYLATDEAQLKAVFASILAEY